MGEKNKVTIGFMAMMAVTGFVNVSSTFASNAAHVEVAERIGHGGSTYRSKSDRADNCQVKVDMVERIGAGGATYSSSHIGDCQVVGDEPKNVHVIERIGAGGPTYSPSRPVS